MLENAKMFSLKDKHRELTNKELEKEIDVLKGETKKEKEKVAKKK